ncbi:MAG: hypothetical protein AAGC93_31990 [Cyanobacteria bacterium P01_F01_bin.53]
MPRKPKKKCIECATLSTQEARQVHGSKKDGCWDEKLCHRRRTYYRKRREGNERRRAEYRQKVAGEQVVGSHVETVSLSVAEDSVPYANLYIWREKRKDAPIHAIAASVFQDGSKVLEVAPIHCAGYRKRQIERYVQKEVMGYLNARFGITFFAEEIRLEPIECRIEGCPFSDRLESGTVSDG